MSRQHNIKTIEQLFPADAPMAAAANTGTFLLEQARAECVPQDWRQESDAVLERYAQLCVEVEVQDHQNQQQLLLPRAS